MGANATKSRDINSSVNQSSDNEWQTSPNKLYLRKKEKSIDKDIMDNLETSKKKISYNESRNKSHGKMERKDIEFRDQHLSKEHFSKQRSLKVSYD